MINFIHIFTTNNAENTREKKIGNRRGIQNKKRYNGTMTIKMKTLSLLNEDIQKIEQLQFEVAHTKYAR